MLFKKETQKWSHKNQTKPNKKKQEKRRTKWKQQRSHIESISIARFQMLCKSNRVFIFILCFFSASICKISTPPTIFTLKAQHIQFAFVSSVSLMPKYLCFLFRLTTTTTTTAPTTMKTNIIFAFTLHCFYFSFVVVVVVVIILIRIVVVVGSRWKHNQK